MKEGFRQSMAWLHTWSGLLVGWVLFLVFSAGTATYYRQEISLWMRPELHAIVGHLPSQIEAAENGVAAMQRRGVDATRWFINLPDEREPLISVFWNPPKPAPGRKRFESASFDPRTGEPVEGLRETRGGEFIYRLHFDLHYMPAIWARWIVGCCAMVMLVAIISGVITHKRIFKDFFSFRPKKGQRSWLDAHNASAVLALPYHLMITYTGLVTLMFIYMPWASQAAYRGDQDSFFAEAFGRDKPPAAAGRAAALTPIAPLMQQAAAHWAEDGVPARIARIEVSQPNDANARITLTRETGERLSSRAPSISFDGASGRLLQTHGETPSATQQTYSVFFGLHLANFAGPLLRALFFLSGLAGCAMVATGVILWAVKERQAHLKRGRIGFGLRLVDGLNIGAIAGLPIAYAAYFWANRLLPIGLAERPAAEAAWFFIAWGSAAALGLAWPVKRCWQLLLWTAAVMLAGLPLLNALTTPTHLGVSLRHGPWPVAGFDLTLLALGLGFGAAAWFVGRHKPRTKARAATLPQGALP